jgi:succinylglutamic semialdehyde dehydrogenase
MKPSDCIDGRLVPIPGDALVSRNPAQPDQVIWSGTPDPSHVDAAVGAARAAAAQWARHPLDERARLLRSWQRIVTLHAERIATQICDEMGKTLAEARAEAAALAAKVEITLEDASLGRVRDFSTSVAPTRQGWCRFRPHGVVAVIGPFNFPAHLPNGQFVPALLLGNTVVFKPSEKTPGVGQLLAQLMLEAGAPPGVFNVVQGDGRVAALLVQHPGVDGILFTGSWPVGRRILEANLDTPGRLVALEMGGNNPAIVLADAAPRQALIECARAAFATTGQRCTCTRRVIVEAPIAERFIAALGKVASTLIAGQPRGNGPVFMGPLVTDEARRGVLRWQEELARGGATTIVPCSPLDQPGWFLSAGVVAVERFTLDRDCEIFGPLLQVSVARDLDDAIAQANATRYGLAASIFTRRRDAVDEFLLRVRAGCANANTGTAGASSRLPFGGLGRSGNHRPGGLFAADACAYPQATLLESSADAALPEGMLLEERWLGLA